MKRLDTCFGIGNRALQFGIELRRSGRKLGLGNRERGQFAAVETPRQRAQCRIAVRTHLIEDARNRFGQFGCTFDRRAPQGGAARVSTHRAPVEDRQLDRRIVRARVHASIFSTGNTSN